MSTNSDTAEYAQGYADAAGWLPNASPDELREFAEREGDKYTIFIYGDHSLAAYWGVAEEVGYGSTPVGDVDPWAPVLYGGGFYAALHDLSPNIFEAAQ
jgi:hypothetical protein